MAIGVVSSKKKTIKHDPQRNAQFENIARLKATYQALGNPVISMDTKKKEPLGLLYRAGQCYTQADRHAYDHDFWSLADGVAIPHGVYDLQRNHGRARVLCFARMLRSSRGWRKHRHGRG